MCNMTHSYVHGIHICKFQIKTQYATNATGWRRCIGCLALYVSFPGLKRATYYRALSRKTTNKDEKSFESSPLCILCISSFAMCHDSFTSDKTRFSRWTNNIIYTTNINVQTSWTTHIRTRTHSITRVKFLTNHLRGVAISRLGWEYTIWASISPPLALPRVEIRGKRKGNGIANTQIHHSNGALRSVNVKEIFVLGLISPRIQASPQRL